jgi:hypothetical protein
LREPFLHEVAVDTDEARRVAHEVNNALAVIGTLSELLLRGRRPDDPERADLEEIQAATERAAAAVRRLEDTVRAGPSRPPADEADSRRVEGARRSTLLLVESDARTRGVLRRFLVPRGFEVLDASSWAEAMALVERGGFAADLLVSRRQPDDPGDGQSIPTAIPRLALPSDVASALETPTGRSEVLARLESHLPA